MTGLYGSAGRQRLLLPSPAELAAAPELGILAAIDALLATAAYHLQAEHRQLSLEALAHGELPSCSARAAGRLISHCADLRAEIRAYRLFAVDTQNDDPVDQLDLPF
jgi:hypothetical protein